ncbi:uncharacterized protein TNCV_4020381 [Trichonephila clavipes]|nr:uncharacterized protein TNCV_4020381 [Trichonephila clavipes]
MMFTSMHGLIPKWFYLGCLHPRNWKPYIANRTSEILDLVPARDSWRYVPTKMNPADIACRGLSPKRTSHMCSMVGRPSMAFLWEMDSWPKQPKRNDRLVQCQRKENEQLLASPVAVNCDFIDSLFLKFSSFTKIIDIFAFCFRYITKLYRTTTSKQLMGDLPTHGVTPSRPFSVCGVDYAGPISILRYEGAKTTKGIYSSFLYVFVTSSTFRTGEVITSSLSIRMRITFSSLPLGYLSQKMKLEGVKIVQEDNIPPTKALAFGRVKRIGWDGCGEGEYLALRTVKVVPKNNSP